MAGVPDYTVVLGVDVGHVDHMLQILPNWFDRKQGTFAGRPIVVFYDATEINRACELSNAYLFKIDAIKKLLTKHASGDVSYVPWPPPNVIYEDDPTNRFGKSQRYKMLAGFVHVPVYAVKTPYWLKLDLDVVGVDQDDWIDPEWFNAEPVIVASAWGYTKPADQMLKLDKWVADNAELIPAISQDKPLNLKPNPGSDLVRHKRIISWCGFFHTGFTRFCADLAVKTCGEAKLPVPSQDGFMWYVAQRCEMYYRTVPMKSYGWAHCSGYSAARKRLAEL